jgi:hypothetical protein
LRLLDEDVLARRKCALRQLVVCNDRGRDHDRVDFRVGEDFLEVGRRPSLRVPGRGLGEQVR